MKGQVAGATARLGRDFRGLVGLERRPAGIGAVEVDLVGADVRHDEEAVVRRKVDRVRMGRLGSPVLNDADCFSQPAVSEDANGGHRSANVVGHGQHAAAGVEADVTGAPALGRCPVQQPQPAGSGLDGIGADRSGLAGQFVDGVKSVVVRMDGQERRGPKPPPPGWPRSSCHCQPRSG